MWIIKGRIETCSAPVFGIWGLWDEGAVWHLMDSLRDAQCPENGSVWLVHGLRSTEIPHAGKRGWDQEAPSMEWESLKMEFGIQAPHPFCSCRNGSLECHNPPLPSFHPRDQQPCRQSWKWIPEIFLSPCHRSNSLTPHARKSWIPQDLGLSRG